MALGGRPAEGQKDLPGTCSPVFSPTGVGRQAHSHEPWTVTLRETLSGNRVGLEKEENKDRSKISDEDPQKRKGPGTEGSSGDEATLRLCVREKEAHRIPYEKEAKNGEGEKKGCPAF